MARQRRSAMITLDLRKDLNLQIISHKTVAINTLSESNLKKLLSLKIMIILVKFVGSDMVNDLSLSLSLCICYIYRLLLY